DAALVRGAERAEPERPQQPKEREEQEREPSQYGQARVLLERPGELPHSPGESQVEEELEPAGAPLVAAVAVGGAQGWGAPVRGQATGVRPVAVNRGGVHVHVSVLCCRGSPAGAAA